MPDVTSFVNLDEAAIAPGTRIVVTGATGFVGGRLVERLARTGADITCLVRGMNAGKRLHRAGARIRQIDLANPVAVSEQLRGISLVFHLAYDWGDPAWNVATIRALIDACLVNRCERLVHVSSFVVYDIPDAGEVSEASEPSPATSGYSHTKLELEAEILRAVNERDLPATIIQPANIYGPHSRPWTIDPAEMLHYGTVVLPEDDSGIFSNVYVDDVISALILAAIRPQAIGQRYLVSGPSTITWAQFYSAIAGAIGAKGPEYRTVKDIERSFGKLGKLRQLASEPTRAVHRILQIGPVHKIAHLSMRLLPRRVRRLFEDRWLVEITHLRGHVHLPSPNHLRFLQSRATIKTGKAHDELGYIPAFDFAQGMKPTAKFLNEVHFKQGARS